jgi:hypothetical protein
MPWIVRPPYVTSSALCFVLAACDEGETASASQESCKQLCAKLEVCNDATDVPGCEQHCTAEVVRSDAYFHARARCVDRLSCNHLVTELGTSGESTCTSDCQVEDCVDDALASEGNSQEMEELCLRTSTKLAACDHGADASAIAASCMDLAPAMSADYREESGACIDLACERIDSCLAETADRYNTDLRIDSATL